MKVGWVTHLVPCWCIVLVLKVLVFVVLVGGEKLVWCALLCLVVFVGAVAKFCLTAFRACFSACLAAC